MKITPFLMFTGQADEAIGLYTSLFPRSSVIRMERYKQGEHGKEGTVKTAVFEINGTQVMCIDSPVPHAFSFTPSFSLFVDCDSQEELNRLFQELSTGGKVMMPLGNYGFSQWFGWTSDRFGVSWQLNLP